MFSSQLNQVLAHVSGTIRSRPLRVASIDGSASGLHVDIPLVGQPRLDHHARAVAVGRGDGAVLDRDQRALGFEQLDYALPSLEALQPEQLVGISPSASGTNPRLRHRAC
jgi:hypothetical protein